MRMMLKQYTNNLKYNQKYANLWTIVATPYAHLFFQYFDLVRKTSAITIDHRSDYSGPCVYINWHQHLPYVLYHHGGYDQTRCHLLMSQAPYMTPVGKFIELCGINVVRGGSGEDNSAALGELKSQLLAGDSIVLAVDGPAGPAYKVKRGCIDLAKATGRPIVHVSYTCVKGKEDESRWDRWITPRPYDTMHITYEKPYYVGDKSVEETALELEGLYRPS